MRCIEKSIKVNNRVYSLMNCKDGYYLTISGKKVSFLGKSFSAAQDLFLKIALG